MLDAGFESAFGRIIEAGEGGSELRGRQAGLAGH
jgi:hypothetical protein